MRMVSTKQVGTIGHRLYNNMTVMKELAKAIPGQTPESFEHQMNGVPLPEGYRSPRVSAADALAGARAALKGGPQIAGLGHEVADMERRAEQLGRRPSRPANAFRRQTAGPHGADHRHGGARVGHQPHEHVRRQSPHEPHRAALRRRRRDERARRDTEPAQRRPAGRGARARRHRRGGRRFAPLDRGQPARGGVGQTAQRRTGIRGQVRPAGGRVRASRTRRDRTE